MTGYKQETYKVFTSGTEIPYTKEITVSSTSEVPVLLMKEALILSATATYISVLKTLITMHIPYSMLAPVETERVLLGHRKALFLLLAPGQKKPHCLALHRVEPLLLVPDQMGTFPPTLTWPLPLALKPNSPIAQVGRPRRSYVVLIIVHLVSPTHQPQDHLMKLTLLLAHRAKIHTPQVGISKYEWDKQIFCPITVPRPTSAAADSSAA